MKGPFQNKKKDKTSGQEDNTTPSFFKRVGQYFSAEPQKEKVLRPEDFDAAGDIYYATVSSWYKVAQRILWLVFVFFVVASILIHRQEITYDNLFYLMKDFTNAGDTGENQYETLSYESDSRQQFVLYRGGVASVSPSKMSIFTATGRRTLNTTSSFSSPYAVSSDKYVLVYDTSGTTVSLYNSFARVYTETLQYPVTDACLGEDGSFAIVTRSADSRSVICVYDKSFHKDAELSADYYVFDIALQPKQNRLAFLYYEVGNGTGQTVLSVRELSTMKELHRIGWDGEFPLGCTFLEKDRFAVVTDGYIRILTDEFEERDISEGYGNGTVTGYSLSAEGVAVSASMNFGTAVVAFDKSGNLLYNDSVDFTVSDLAVYDSYIFLQTERGVTRMKTGKNGFVEQLDSGSGKLLIYNEQTALVCGESKAEYLIFRGE